VPGVLRSELLESAYQRGNAEEAIPSFNAPAIGWSGGTVDFVLTVSGGSSSVQEASIGRACLNSGNGHPHCRNEAVHITDPIGIPDRSGASSTSRDVPPMVSRSTTASPWPAGSTEQYSV
ncbi:MAG: hypothetical protein P8I74_05175, partial [Phycisphaerales bacterium]|nr:hypothetical protein [Phycisphaerales bacterium]